MIICPYCKLPAPKGSQIVEGNVTIFNEIVSNTTKKTKIRRTNYNYDAGITTLLCDNCNQESTLHDPSYDTVVK